MCVRILCGRAPVKHTNPESGLESFHLQGATKTDDLTGIFSCLQREEQKTLLKSWMAAQAQI